MAFLEPGLIALGDAASLRRALDAHHTGHSVSGNEEMMRLVGEIETGSNAWAAHLAGFVSLAASIRYQLSLAEEAAQD